MVKIIFENDVPISLDSIDEKEDLNPKAKIWINPLPEDGRCECCRKHISELKPFGGPGDQLAGDLTEAKLVEKFRPEGPYDEEAEMAYAEAEKNYIAEDFDHPLDWLICKYGRKKALELDYAVELYRTMVKSWECRDCAFLDVNEYFEKQDRSLADQNKNKN